MAADSSRDVGGGRAVVDRGRRTGRDSDPEAGRHVPKSSREVKRFRGHELPFRAVAVGVVAVVALVTAVIFVVTTPGSGGFGSLGGVLAFGVVGLAASSDGDDAIATLTAKVERARAGEQVEFRTDRDDGLGDLAAAVEGLAEECQAAERERDLHERVMESAPVGISVGDATEEEVPLISVNERFEELTGYEQSEVVGRNRRFLQGEATEEEPVAELRRALAAGEETTVELRNYRKDGTQFWNQVRLAPIEDDDGEVTHYVGFQEDVTERKERERRLEALVQNTKDPIFIKDSEGRYQFVNESIAALFGFERAEIVGKTDEKLFDEETVADIVSDDEQVLETGEYLSREVVRPVDGDERIFLDDKYPYRDDDGEIIGLMGISRDITEQKETERALREREQRLEEYKEYTEDVLDAIDDVFYVLDEEGSLERWNQALVDVTGYDDIESVHATDFFVEEDQQAIAEGIVRALETGDARAEAPYQTKDGELIPFEFEASRMTDPDGETVVVGIGRDISERKEAQAALLEREQRLEEYREYTEDILDAIDDVFYVFDETGSIQRWNESLTDVTGYTDEEIESMHGADFFPEYVHETVMDAIPAVFESGEDRRVDAPVLTKDGEEIPYEFVATRVEAPDVDPVLVGVGRDISERKAREREVRKTKNRIQRFIETSPVGVVASDPDGVVTLWNDAMETIFGWSEDEVLGEPYPAIPEDRRGEDEVRQRVLEGESVTQVECKRVRKDGEEIDISLSTAPIHDDDGSVSEIVAYIEDITERKQRERELVARSAAIEQSIDGIAVLNDEGVYEYVNEAHVEVYGYDDPETFLGERWERCYDAAESERLAEEAMSALNSVGDWRGEAVGKRADGSTYPQEVSLTKIDDGRIICVIRDITDRKERERELQRTKDLLQQAGSIAAVGGWELDLTGESPEMTWSDELYRIHGVPTDTEVDPETTVELSHPQDQPKIRQSFQRAVEAGESYDMEVRLQPTEDSMRWVRAIGEPVYEGDEVVRVRGSIQDITPQKEREIALQSLHEATRGLLGVDTDTETARLVVDTAQSVLDVAGVAVFLLDESTNMLDAVSCSTGFERLCESNPVGASDSDSLLWNTYVTGQPTVFDDTQAVANSQVFGPEVGGGLLVPLGDHGVFVVATQERVVDPKTRQLAETLVATTEAAFDRLASEATLRERDEELAEQNRALRRQIQITNLLRRIDQSLIQAGSREEVEAAVCNGLVESDDIAFAWIGALDVTGERVDPSVWAGDGTEYLDSVSLATAGEAVEPSAATALSESPTVVSNVVEELKREPWRKTALGAEFQSVLSVPLAFEEYFYGVLTVYANESEAFGDLEREVFAELGENIAHSINAVETQRALHTDQRVELTLDFDAEDDVLGRLACEVGCDIEFAGLAAHTETETDLFIGTTGAPTERVAGVLDDLLSVSEYRLVRDETAGDDGEEAPADASALFELTIDSDTLPARFVRHGASPNSIRASSEGIVTIVDVPRATDVRSFVEMLQETHPSADLVSRQTVERSQESGATLVNSLFDALTDRQLEVLRTAYFAGFFEWPRTSTGEEVAEMLGVSQPTVNRHLRLGQQRLLEQLFEERGAEVVVEAG